VSTDAVQVRSDSNGRAALVPIRVQPGARKSGAAGAWNGQLKLAVAAPAVDGRANEALLTLVAELFGLRRRAVELVRGSSSRTKLVRLALPPAEVELAIERLLRER
jgi:uncharacterized protein (TIGR00251 family)